MAIMQESEQSSKEKRIKMKRKLKTDSVQTNAKKLKSETRSETEQSDSTENTKGQNRKVQKDAIKKTKKLDKGNRNEKPDQPSEKPDWLKFKKEKKELKEKRKAQRLSDTYAMSLKVKQISEKLRRSNCSEFERKQLISEAHSLLKGHYDKMIFTHDMSRIIQWLLKYSISEIRTAIFCELKPCIVSMLQSKYASKCIKVMIEHCSQEIKSEIVSACYGNVVRLIGSTISAPILEHVYANGATILEKTYFKQEFYGDMYKQAKDKGIKSLSDVFKSAPEMKTATLSAVKGNLLRILNKKLINFTLVHHVLWEYLNECSTEDRNEMIVMLRSSLVELSQTKHGSKVAAICIWYGTNKDKKIMIKALKGNIKSICLSENGYRVMLALFDSVDDTVLVKKIILAELQKDLTEVALNEHGKHVILYLVARRDPHYFPPDLVKYLEQGDNNETSKKPGDVKMQELLPAILDPLLDAIITDTSTWLSKSSIAVVTLAILKAASGDKLKHAFKSISTFITNPDSKIIDHDTEYMAVEHVGLHMTLKKLLQHDKTLQEKAETTFGEILVDHLTVKVIQEWIKNNRGCFLLIVLLENEAESVVKTLVSKLKPMANKLKSLSSPGAKI